MEQELINEINKVIYYVNEFNNGHDEYVKEAEEVLNGVFDYVKSANKFYIEFRILIALCEFRYTMMLKLLARENSDMERLIGYCKDDIFFYKDSMKKLKKYCKYVDKTGEAKNLDDAYILSIKLSELLATISEYFTAINNLESNILSNPGFVCKSEQVNHFVDYSNQMQMKEIIKKIER